MDLFEGFSIVEPYPALYVEHLDAVVIADLHLGLESLMAREGTYMPKFQRSEMEADIDAVLEETDASTLIVCGDMKHEFSETSYGEREEVQELIEFLSSRVEDILLVKGNHDNYLIYPVKEYDNVKLEDLFVLEGTCFLHGHQVPESLAVQSADTLIIGHEHPAVTLKDEVGVTEKVPAFLYGTMDDGRRIIVLPAFSKLAEGSQVNQVREEELLSPVLRELVNIEELKAVGVDREAGLLPFPALRKLR